MASLTAVLVDCSSEPGASASTEGPLRELAGWYGSLGVAVDLVQLSDEAVSAGTDATPEWERVLARLGAADIIVMGLPHSAGPRSGVEDLVIEQVILGVAGPSEQFPLLNKVGAVVGAPDDGGPAVAEMLSTFAELGCTAAPGTDMRSLASSTVHLARILRDSPLPGADGAEPSGQPPLPRRLFGNLPTGSLAIDAAAIEAERREAAEGRLIERRRTYDLTRREKGLPEKRNLPRPKFPPAGEQPTS